MKTSFPATWCRPLLALLLATAAPADAQDAPPVMFDGLAGSMAMNKLLFDNTTGRATGSRVATKSFAYVPSAALKQKTVQGYVDRLKTKNPTAAQAVATTFGTGKYDYGTVYRGLIDGYNLRENDAVDAMTAYLVLGWMIVNNVQNDKAVTAAMVQGARAQVAPLLASNAKLAAPGVAAQVGEEMKLQSVIAQAGWQSAVKQGTLPVRPGFKPAQAHAPGLRGQRRAGHRQPAGHQPHCGSFRRNARRSQRQRTGRRGTMVLPVGEQRHRWH
jgi:hypothetical protein